MYAGIGRHRLLALAGAGFLPVCAYAATPPTPGAIGDTLKQPPALQPPAPSPTISTPQGRAPAGAARNNTLVVTQFVFSGNTLFSDTVLAALVAEYLNRPITLGELYEAADKIADFYARKGYALASVNVPAQKMKGGTVRLEVLEGRIGKVVFDGNHHYHDDVLRGFASQTHPKDVYRSAPLEHDLQMLNSLPGLAARAVIQPGSDYGTSDVTLKMQEDRVDGYVVLDNYGRKDTGQYRMSASVTLNNPTGVGDQLQVLGTHSSNNRLNYGYVDYNVPLNFSGLRFDANFGHAHFRAPAGTANVSGKNNNLQLNLIQPWIHSALDKVVTSAGYIHTNSNADVLGIPLTTPTNINLLNLGASYTHIWSNSALTQYIASIHTNFAQASAAHPNRERVRVELNAQHLQPLPARLQLLGLLDVLYSPDPLADTEQFSVGGPTSVRGFPSSEVRGSRGFFGQLTLRRPFVMGPVSLVPRVYGDSGVAAQVFFPPAPRHSDSLTSAGLGADVFYKTVTLKVDWSYPFDHKPVSDGRDDGRVYASLTAGF